MKRWIIGSIVTVAAILFHPRGPLTFLKPMAGVPSTDFSLIPYFFQLDLFEAIALGYAVVFAVFAYPRKAIGRLSLAETRSGWFALVWSLGNWWLHDTLHVLIGWNQVPLLFVEFGFHLTTVVAIGYLVYLVSKYLLPNSR